MGEAPYAPIERWPSKPTINMSHARPCRYLLPPVIFYCGLSVEKSRFFLALPSILMYGVFGTLTSFIIISVFMYLTLGFAMFNIEVRGNNPSLLNGWQRCKNTAMFAHAMPVRAAVMPQDHHHVCA